MSPPEKWSIIYIYKNFILFLFFYDKSFIRFFLIGFKFK